MTAGDVARGYGRTALCVLASIAARSAAAESLDPCACAALDLHLIRQVEFAGLYGTIEGDALREIVEAVAVARRLCREGRVAQALRLYGSIDAGGASAELR